MKDAKIRYRPAELQVVAALRAFCISNANLRGTDMATRFVTNLRVPQEPGPYIYGAPTLSGSSGRSPQIEFPVVAGVLGSGPGKRPRGTATSMPEGPMGWLATRPSGRRPARRCTYRSPGMSAAAGLRRAAGPSRSPRRASWPRSRRPRGTRARQGRAPDLSRRRGSRGGPLGARWPYPGGRAPPRAPGPRRRGQPKPSSSGTRVLSQQAAHDELVVPQTS
jgi:hypothetical protein